MVRRFFPCLKPLHLVVGVLVAVLVAVLVLQALQEELLWEEGVPGDANPVSLNHTVFMCLAMPTFSVEQGKDWNATRFELTRRAEACM